MWAVLPIKDLADAKQRLASVLTAVERRRLFSAMVEDVLSALTEARGLDGVLVVSRDPGAAALARRYGARLLAEEENRGQTAAVTAAAAALAAEGVGGVMTLPGDAPLVGAAEIEQVIAAHGRAPAVTIVPAWDERGSNCVACSPPGVIPFHFGNDSFQPHLAAARAAAITPRVLKLPGIALDVDNPRDLRALLRRAGTTRAHAYLHESGLATRLAKVETAAAGG